MPESRLGFLSKPQRVSRHARIATRIFIQASESVPTCQNRDSDFYPSLRECPDMPESRLGFLSKPQRVSRHARIATRIFIQASESVPTCQNRDSDFYPSLRECPDMPESRLGFLSKPLNKAPNLSQLILDNIFEDIISKQIYSGNS